MNNDIDERILTLLPADSSTMGNKAVLKAISDAGADVSDEHYQASGEGVAAVKVHGGFGTWLFDKAFDLVKIHDIVNHHCLSAASSEA